ncbi:MAG: peptidoglycan-associated lipoprotein Pal [Deltaproteobacteria bacterium]|nr:peptidoglycan-associated lipoprotein Pal [Deltaproteobacteria bacterium]
MKRTAFILPFVLFCFVSLLFVNGCAKKTVLKEAAVSKEATAAAESKADKTALKDGADAKGREAASKAKAAKESAKNLYEMADIHFEYDKYSLKPEDREILKNHAEWLNKNQKVKIMIEGHCDERGTAEYNLALGERRALEAKNYIVKLGVVEKRVSTVSYGKERPLDPGHNETAWAKNRRDRFVLP